jgi:hypothetical protein
VTYIWQRWKEPLCLSLSLSLHNVSTLNQSWKTSYVISVCTHLLGYQLGPWAHHIFHISGIKVNRPATSMVLLPCGRPGLWTVANGLCRSTVSNCCLIKTLLSKRVVDVPVVCDLQHERNALTTLTVYVSLYIINGNRVPRNLCLHQDFYLLLPVVIDSTEDIQRQGKSISFRRLNNHLIQKILALKEPSIVFTKRQYRILSWIQCLKNKHSYPIPKNPFLY